MLLSLQDEYGLSEEQLTDSLFNASAIGCLAMRNATVAGAVGGCQAEVGVASAMAASAAVELMGGKPFQCLDAAAITLMDMLGLVCDPIGGLVECPCQQRNASGASVALTAAEMVLSGVKASYPLMRCCRPCIRWEGSFPQSLGRPPLEAVRPHRPEPASAAP